MTIPSGPPAKPNSHVVPEAIPASPARARDAEEREIPLAETAPRPGQPRKYFDPERAKELAASLQEHGLLNAIIVYPSPVPPSYRIIAGERRWRAANALGWKTIRARVLKGPLDEARLSEMMLIDNDQRQDLSDIERGVAYLDHRALTGCTASALAQMIGKPVSTVTRAEALVKKLPQDLRALIGPELPPSIAGLLTSLPDDDAKRHFAGLYREGKVRTGKELSAAIKAAKNGHVTSGTAGFSCEENGIKIACYWSSDIPDPQALANVENVLRILLKDLAGQKHRGLTHWKHFLEKKAKAARKASELKAAQDALARHGNGANGTS